jgi:hypothetical protein
MGDGRWEMGDMRLEDQGERQLNPFCLSLCLCVCLLCALSQEQYDCKHGEAMLPTNHRRAKNEFAHQVTWRSNTRGLKHTN